jgi:hypothetical protein
MAAGRWQQTPAIVRAAREVQHHGRDEGVPDARSSVSLSRRGPRAA